MTLMKFYQQHGKGLASYSFSFLVPFFLCYKHSSQKGIGSHHLHKMNIYTDKTPCVNFIVYLTYAIQLFASKLLLKWIKNNTLTRIIVVFLQGNKMLWKCFITLCIVCSLSCLVYATFPILLANHYYPPSPP